MKVKLTDLLLRKMPPAPAGKRITVWDTEVGNFGVRVTDRLDPVTKKPRRTFIVMRRLSGRLIRHKIGVYPAVTLQAAREAARDANMDFERGVDPKAKRLNQLASEAKRREHTFAIVAEEFIKRHVLSLRSGRETAASIRRELISRWDTRPITEINPEDIVKMAEAIIDAGKPAAARKMLAHASKLFAWAVSRKTFGLATSPCAEVSPKDIIGKKSKRQRVLTDAELLKLWTAVEEEAYPLGPFVQILMLTGQRLREVAEAQWSEIDIDTALWTIPAERMKADAAHEIPLSPTAVAILRKLPTFEAVDKTKASIGRSQREKNASQFVFTTTSGTRPISGFSKFKAHLDEKLIGLPAWVFHDLRRTVRTRLSGLSIPHNICELVIAHRQTELDQIYDQHRYLKEKRDALSLWDAQLMQLVLRKTDDNSR